MKYQQPPLVIECAGLSKKLIAILADKLALHFEEIKIWEDEIEAINPINGDHYIQAWRTIDRWGVKAR